MSTNDETTRNDSQRPDFEGSLAADFRDEAQQNTGSDREKSSGRNKKVAPSHFKSGPALQVATALHPSQAGFLNSLCVQPLSGPLLSLGPSTHLCLSYSHCPLSHCSSPSSFNHLPNWSNPLISYS